MEAVACLKMFCTSAINLGPSSRNHNADTINWAPSTISLLRAICPSLRASWRFLGVGCSVFASMLYCLLFELTHLHVSPYVYLRRFSDAPPVACDFASAHRVRAARAFVFAAGAAYPAGKRACKYAANSSLTSG